MRAILQRVSEARVRVAGRIVGEVTSPGGWLILLGVAVGDTLATADTLATRAAHFRAFPDDAGKMNRSVLDLGGQCLVVSNFTLAADTRSGRRPSFTTAAPPDVAEPLYLAFVAQLQVLGIPTTTGQFGQTMQVELTNDGPATFMLEG